LLTSRSWPCPKELDPSIHDQGDPERKRLLEAEIVKMSKKHPTPGYKKIARKLREMGFKVGKNLVQKVRREEGLLQQRTAPSVAGLACARGICQKKPVSSRFQSPYGLLPSGTAAYNRTIGIHLMTGGRKSGIQAPRVIRNGK
jgi:hypothetical protein